MANTLKFGNGEWYGKKDTILAYNDENSNFKPLPFSFDRASSATVINKDGLIETVGSGEPRIDYKDDSKGALLLEPSRTNYVLYSETDGIIRGSNGWSGDSDSTITQNYGTTPFNGSELKSTRIQFTGYSKEFRNIFPSVTIIPTCSIWIKGSVGKTIKFGSNGNEGVFTLNGEWQKLVQTGSSSSTSRLTINTYSSTTARDIEIFAPQLEQGSYATSYIPTQGSAVTRNSDSCSQTVPSEIIGQTEGTVFLDSKMALQSINNYQLFSINNGGGSDRIRILTATGNRLRFIYQLDGGDLVYSFYNPTDYGDLTSLKIAFTYKSGDIKVYINGVLVDSSSNTFTIAETLTNIDIASTAGGYSQMFLNDVKLYNTALTDAELQALTSN